MEALRIGGRPLIANKVGHRHVCLPHGAVGTATPQAFRPVPGLKVCHSYEISQAFLRLAADRPGAFDRGRFTRWSVAAPEAAWRPPCALVQIVGSLRSPRRTVDLSNRVHQRNAFCERHLRQQHRLSRTNWKKWVV
jgi:hypothetical protein